MKKYINICLWAVVVMSSLSLASCKNEVDEIFDDDAVARLDKAKNNYISILTNNGEGCRWQMEYFANADEPGYIYLMTFAKDGTVTISGRNEWIDHVVGGSGTLKTYGSEVSLWEVITDNGPVLSFNTFNKYFHLFADPEDIPAAAGASSDNDTDETGYGHEGDYEFDLMKYSNDTLYITGKKYGIDMIMTRVPDKYADKDDVTYMDEVVALTDSFFNAKLPQVYLNLPDGNRWIVKEGASGIIKMFREGADEISTSEYHNIIITHDGVSFMNPVTIDGVTMQHFDKQDDGSLLSRSDGQTTMTADELSLIFSDQDFTWWMYPENAGGTYADYCAILNDELYSYNKTSLEYMQITYEAANSCYSVGFYAKKGAAKYLPKYYADMEVIGENQVKFVINKEGDRTGKSYITNCPTIGTILDLINSSTFELSANSLLLPINMRLETVGNTSDYMVWTLQ